MAHPPESKDKPLFAGEYGDKFDAEAYATNLYSMGAADEVHCGFPLGLLHKFWNTFPQTGLKVLDFGAGPTPTWQISSTLHASEIVYAEFAESNRKALQRWLDGDSSVHDWSPYFKYVVQTLEKKGEDEVKAREAKLRSLAKAVVPCDATQDPPIQSGYEGPYDVVMSFLCLPTACKTEEEYQAVIARMAGLLKPGGKLVMYDAEEPTNSYYTYHTWKFHYLAITEGMVRTALDRAGFKDVQVEKLATEGLQLPSLSKETNYKAIMFITATKPSE